MAAGRWRSTASSTWLKRAWGSPQKIITRLPSQSTQQHSAFQPLASGINLGAGQRQALLIFARQLQRHPLQPRQWPVDGHLGVVPLQATLMLRRVIVGGLVEGLGAVRQYQKTMGEAFRHPQSEEH